MIGFADPNTLSRKFDLSSVNSQRMIKSTIKYVIVTPVRDEESHIEMTLQSMAVQTVKPLSWVIVDDGSKDRTAEIIKRFIHRYPFISIVNNPIKGKRGPGAGVISALIMVTLR